MMKNKINFVSGETYTLSELFSGNRKIIIPDLQRDYCWGDKIHTNERKELVSGFVNNLINQFINNEHQDLLNLGLLYGYENPVNHIQLCDGQQRITTLYLLLGMLNRRVANNCFRRYLISDFEYFQDDKEPYLQYSIRESSLYFLSDLVCHFFIKNEDDKYSVDKCEDIQKCSWFFNDYKCDPSIQSMIRAIIVINEILTDKDSDWCYNFGMFLTTKLSFMYYDMESRKNGEETFVVINTTGEPLSSSQNLKPLVLNESANQNTINMPQRWEEMETWFWQKRNIENGNDTADAGFNEFLRWVILLEENDDDENSFKTILSEGKYATFPKEKISFEEIYSYWKIVSFLFDTWENKDRLNKDYLSPKEIETEIEIESNKVKIKVKAISQIDCFLLLPLIAYCKQWGIKENNNRNLLRLYQFLRNLRRIENVSKNVNTLVKDVIRIAKDCKDVVSIIDRNLSISGSILTKEEELKLRIVKDAQERNKVEEAFWNAQDCEEFLCHNIWSGQILPLIIWSCSDENYINSFSIDTFSIDSFPIISFSINSFNAYVEIFHQTFKEECDKHIDNVRRALLTRSLTNYPIKGKTNYSFGWLWTDWNTLINYNIKPFKDFLDDLRNGSTLSKMKEEFDSSHNWSEFVYKDYLLEYCQEKNIQWDEKEGWLLIQKKRATKYMSVKNLHLYHYLTSKLNNSNWEVRIYDESDGHLVVVENKSENLVFDIWYIQLSKQQWILQFFSRGMKCNEVEETLKRYIDTSTWNFNGERYEKSVDLGDDQNYSYPTILDELQKIISQIP